jgi:cytochrome oxidase assembly protein ShyY1
VSTTTAPDGTRPSGPGPGPAGALPTARAALRLLREGPWWRALAGVVVLSVVFVLLGRWQYHRHEARTARNDLVERNWSAAPAPLTAVLPGVATDPGRALPRALEWRPVRLQGRYLPERTVLLRNRPHDGQNGYDVVVPFRTDGARGLILLIDRGWVPAGSRSAAEPDQVPAAPAGPVTVVARLRPSEPPTSRRAPAGQANRLAVSRLAAGLGPEPVVDAYGLLIGESPAPAQPLAAAEKPDPGLGINLAYAVQWVVFALAAYGLLGVAMVREVRRRAGEEPRPLRLPWRRRERDEYDEDD